MENENMITILSVSDEADANRASDYLKECNVACTIENTGSGYALMVSEEESGKALELLKDVLPEYFPAKEDETEEEEVETAVKESNLVLMDILGKVTLALAVIAVVLGFLIKIPYIKIITGVIAGLAIIFNGYVGLKSQKTVPILLCIFSIVLIVVGIFFTEVKRDTSQGRMSIADALSKANRYLSSKNYEKAFEYYNKALEISIEIKDINAEIASLQALGATYGQNLQYDKAIEYYEKVFQKCKEIDNPLMGDLIRPDYERIKNLVGNSLKLEAAPAETK